MTGIQALVRLPLDRKRLDLKSGLNTAGFISGYRGSPLGGYDQQINASKKLMDAHDVKLWEGLNEDLGATAVWGSQQTHLFPGAKYDGVSAMWYGKAPGVDRTGDVFKHANFAGTTPKGGVIDSPLRRESIGREAYMRISAPDHPDAETARTRYRTLAATPEAALMELSPETGRMHQLRVHMASLGRPIVGDVRYGGALTVGGHPVPRLMLHAETLGLHHPRSGAWVEFTAPCPF
jgi:hypothetical protein